MILIVGMTEGGKLFDGFNDVMKLGVTLGFPEGDQLSTRDG